MFANLVDYLEAYAQECDVLWLCPDSRACHHQDKTISDKETLLRQYFLPWSSKWLLLYFWPSYKKKYLHFTCCKLTFFLFFVFFFVIKEGDTSILSPRYSPCHIYHMYCAVWVLREYGLWTVRTVYSVFLYDWNNSPCGCFKAVAKSGPIKVKIKVFKIGFLPPISSNKMIPCTPWNVIHHPLLEEKKSPSGYSY